ncbi:MAG: putative S-adenosylmethionine decarboxylase [Actinomycetospora sp.]|nr:putative S-adenosylmethionine decarboxylase [Actinomycetospora sp.]
MTTTSPTTHPTTTAPPSADLASFAGRHVLAELRGVAPGVLGDEQRVVEALRHALHEGGATVLDVVAHRFEPQGATVVALLAESHASVHAYPEASAAFVDVFTCGVQADPELVVDALGRELGATDVRAQVVARGAGLAPAAGGREVDEPLAPGMRRRWRLDEVVWRGRTEWQDMMVARTAQGVSLFCDGERQSTEATQLVYHEALAVPPMLLADELRSVLVVGSSEGVVSRLALDAGATRVDHVDIDVECVRRCAELLPYGYTPAELAAAEAGEGPVRMHYADGWRFLADAAARGDRWDVVIVDLPDEPVEVTDPAQHARLYGTAFLRRCVEVLTPGGVVCSQAGCPTLWRNETLRRMSSRFDDVFTTVLPYCSDEHEWAYLTGRVDPVDDPVALAVSRLHRFPALTSIDAESLHRGAVLPCALRARERLPVS